MAIRVVSTWPKTASERAVKAWMEKSGIDPNKVRSYQTFVEVGSPSTIQINMHFDEEEEG